MWILLVFVAVACSCNVYGLELVNNGYEDIYIIIKDRVPENDTLLDRIQTVFTAASKTLYTATDQRAYFKSVKVIVPKTWTTKSAYKTISSLSLSTAHIRVDNAENTIPSVLGSDMCGQEGLYMYLHDQDFIMKTEETQWGKHEAVIVHLWGHLRWGLKDEHPSEEGPYFYQDSGRWTPVGCTRQMQGYASKDCSAGPQDQACNMNITQGMISPECRFCPDFSSSHTTSLMGWWYIPSVIHFCDRDDPSTPVDIRHNSQAINMQNKLCKGKSSWEVMREHRDFKDGINPPMPNADPPSTSFEVFQEADEVIVFVFDVSGSMSTDNRIQILNTAASFIVTDVIPNGAWLGMVEFETNARVLTNVDRIDSASKRSQFLSQIPTVATGGTCIPCGLELAYEILKNSSTLSSLEGSKVILISDGDNWKGDMDAALKLLNDAGIIIHTIAISQAADSRMEEMSKVTGGRYMSYNSLDSDISLAGSFSEIISGGLNTGVDSTVMMMMEKLSVPCDSVVQMTLNVNEDIGKDTVVSILATDPSDLDLQLTGPNNFTKTKSEEQTRKVSLDVPDTMKPGEYNVEIKSPSGADVEVIATSKPVSSEADIIRPVSRVSSNVVDYQDSATLPLVFLYLRKGETPVKNADITAEVEGPSGTQTCTLYLQDDGLDPDTTANDGIYTAVMHQGCLDGNGRHNSKIIVRGNNRTVASRVLSPAAMNGIQGSSDSTVGEFQRVTLPDSFVVTNYATNTTDITPPGRITDVQLQDILGDELSEGESRSYAIIWTATGDDYNKGQAKSYEMRVSDDIHQLQGDFDSCEMLVVHGKEITPKESGNVEKLTITLSSNDSYTSTAYFAVAAVDEDGNRGEPSNILQITMATTFNYEVKKVECKDKETCFKKIACDGNAIIQNGKLEFHNGREYKAIANIHCNPGYELNGINTTTCLITGIWEELEFRKCLIKDCLATTVENGEVEYPTGATTFGSIANIKCNTGYIINGVDTISCLETGKWNSKPQCVIEEVCVNNHRSEKECNIWARHGYCQINTWMIINCAKACKACKRSDKTSQPDTGSGKASETTVGSCEDGDIHCPTWVKYGFCDNNPRRALVICKKSCNVCSAEGNSCFDKHQLCPVWKKGGQCRRNSRYMLRNCRKSCNVC